jgi:hypothetical protein
MVKSVLFVLNLYFRSIPSHPIKVCWLIIIFSLYWVMDIEGKGCYHVADKHH